MIKDLTIEERTIQLIRNPDAWQLWPILPMKRQVGGGKLPEIGLILDTGKPYVAIFKVDMYTFAGLSVAELQATPVDVYPTAEAAIAAGWIVD